MKFKSLNHIIRSVASQLRPPMRMTVAEAAAKYRYVNQPGAYVGPWLNMTTPYMVEPMNTLNSRHYNKMAFVGPAQSGKTDALILNGITYSVKVDPMDIMVFCPTSTAARDFSMRRVDRLHRHSPEVGAMLMKNRDADNKFDKHYTTGIILTLSYPSVTELAGRPVGRIIITDYDRIDDDIGGDGNAFDLASKRTTTFGSFAMCAAESSPSRPVKDPNWIKKTPHEAPPCDGIVGLYNRGDRRRWKWPCPHCDQYFEGTFQLMKWDTKSADGRTLTNLEKAETARMVCPCCGCEIAPEEKYEMNLWGMWVPEGCTVNEKGQLVGEPVRATFASFWLRGTAAAFISWQTLVLNYLDASDDYERTMSEESLKKFWNNDMGEPYVPKSIESVRVPEMLKARAEPWAEKTVPPAVRFLAATVDVQKHRFEVAVFGVAPGYPFDIYLVDRFNIIKSERLDIDGEREKLSPAAYLEDWELIEKQVMMKTYPLADDPSRVMQVKMTACDSGGAAGVTANAYEYYRKLRREGKNGRFILVKGDPMPKSPRTHIATPDSNRKDKNAIARGDVPVLMINSNMVKDMLNGRLDVTVPGKGMYHFPTWLPDYAYGEMCAEHRDEKGWQCPQGTRNETWDLSYYLIGMCISGRVLAMEAIDWDNPPVWADEWDKNPLVVTIDKPEAIAEKPDTGYSFAQLAEMLA